MPRYYVTWDIDIEADTPEQAALEARKIQLDPDSLATVFTVVDEVEAMRVDLMEVAAHE